MTDKAMTRSEVADWLNQRGIRWAGAAEGAKRPKSTRPKVDADGNAVPSVPWDVHFDEGHMDAGRAEWVAGQLADMYLWPSSINAGDEGAACADLDRTEPEGQAESDARWLRAEVAPNPILEFVKPDGSGKRHVWIASHVRPGNGRILDDGETHVGEWRGKTSEGHLGVGMRMYAGEVEALLRALSGGVGHPMTRAQWERTVGTGGRGSTERNGADRGRSGGRARTEGDRNQGAFVRARSAVERDADPYPAIESAAWDAALAGHTADEAVGATIRGAEYGQAKRPAQWPKVEPARVSDAAWIGAVRGAAGEPRGSGNADERGEPEPPPPDDLAGAFAVWEGFRSAFWKAQAARTPRTLKAFREGASEMLAGVAGRVRPDDPAAGGAVADMDRLHAAHVAGGPEAVKETLERIESEGIETAERCPETAPEPREWLVRGWLPEGRITVYSGIGEGGKSRSALQLAAAIAAGSPYWFPGEGHAKGIPIEPMNADGSAKGARPVVFASWEDEVSECWRKVHDGIAAAIEGEAKVDPGKLPGVFGNRLRFAYLGAKGPVWAPAAGATGHVSTMGALTAAGAWLRRYCEEVGARLLVLDPLAAAYACSEIDRGLVRAFMSSWDQWGIANGCAVLIVSHPSRASLGETEFHSSGSTDWHSAARAAWVLERADTGRGPEREGGGREPDEQPRLSCVKSSYAKAKPEPVWLADFGAGWRAVHLPPAPKGRKRNGNRSVNDV